MTLALYTVDHEVFVSPKLWGVTRPNLYQTSPQSQFRETGLTFDERPGTLPGLACVLVRNLPGPTIRDNGELCLDTTCLLLSSVIQGCLAHRNPLGPYSTICLGPYGVPGGGRGVL